MKYRCSDRQAEDGFSLTELMIMLAAVSILMAAAVPSFNTVRSAYALEAAAHTVYADLQEARIQAITQNTTVSMAFSQSDSSYTSSLGITKSLPNQVSISSVSADPSFFSRGNATISTIVIANPYGTKQIDVSVSGRIRIS